jgi:ribosomal protein S18 acetylase RimI-like enzyme
MITDAQQKDGRVYILEDGQKVVGFVGGVIIEIGDDEEDFDCKPHRMGRITDLFLSEKYRGIGYGAKLMNTLENYFKEKGCYKINIEVFGPNVDSYNFYKRHGYSDRNIDLAKVI